MQYAFKILVHMGIFQKLLLFSKLPLYKSNLIYLRFSNTDRFTQYSSASLNDNLVILLYSWGPSIQYFYQICNIEFFKIHFDILQGSFKFSTRFPFHYSTQCCNCYDKVYNTDTSLNCTFLHCNTRNRTSLNCKGMDI